MNYKLVFERRSEYLYVFVELYAASYEVMREYCEQIATAAAEVPGKRVLVEKAPAEQLSMIEAFQLASELPSLGFARIKLAFVDQAELNEEINNFTEMVGNHRGLNARTFNTVKAAERWLLSR